MGTVVDLLPMCFKISSVVLCGRKKLIHIRTFSNTLRYYYIPPAVGVSLMLKACHRELNKKIYSISSIRFIFPLTFYFISFLFLFYAQIQHNLVRFLLINKKAFSHQDRKSQKTVINPSLLRLLRLTF